MRLGLTLGCGSGDRGRGTGYPFTVSRNIPPVPLAPDERCATPPAARLRRVRYQLVETVGGDVGRGSGRCGVGYSLRWSSGARPARRLLWSVVPVALDETALLGQAPLLAFGLLAIVPCSTRAGGEGESSGLQHGALGQFLAHLILLDEAIWYVWMRAFRRCRWHNLR
jgi:hypothetical protein